MPLSDEDMYSILKAPSLAPDERIELIRQTTSQTIVRKGSFDAGHRVMNERVKCFNIHGHTYLYELCFNFNSSKDIGYNIDFKEIKRVGCQWIEDRLDHSLIINPKDHYLIQAGIAIKSKMWFMSLNGFSEYCNPTVENIAKEMYLALQLLHNNNSLSLQYIRLYETPNCYTECYRHSISPIEKENFLRKHKQDLEKYKKEKGTIEYDDRKI